MEIEVVKKLPSGSEVKASEIPAGNVATCIYVELYGEEMRPAYEALEKRDKKHGLR